MHESVGDDGGTGVRGMFQVFMVGCALQNGGGFGLRFQEQSALVKMWCPAWPEVRNAQRGS